VEQETNMSTERVAETIKLLALDVDGVLSDGKLYYSSSGEELKSFNIKDGLGIKLLQQADIEVAIITGRCSAMVERRAAELGIKQVIQGREDKLVALQQLCQQYNIELSQCAYMGDDLPDLKAINAAGLGMTVANAAKEVLNNADWVSNAQGGEGAVREACEFILGAGGRWSKLTAKFE